MKTVYITTRGKIEAVNFSTDVLPERVCVITTVQFKSDIDKVISYLNSKGKHALFAGTILGCNARCVQKFKESVDAYVYFGSGKFHPIAVALESDKPVYTIHPDEDVVRLLDLSEVDRIKKRKKGMLLKFLSSKTIGVLISTKNGQSKVQGGIDAVKTIEKKYSDKEFYYFLSDTLDFRELENFSFIECWVNTMCPRIMEDISVLNVGDF